jgi:atypical dual specificity phosphatase
VIIGFCSQVTVNSGGVVYFAIFRDKMVRDSEYREAAAVLKFTSSSLVTQSERFGNELAKHMGVLCPQVKIGQAIMIAVLY